MINSTTEARPFSWTQPALFVLAAGFVLLLFTNLDSYPSPWYDEGSHLHVAENYARFGVYADSSLDEWRYYGPAIGVGPTVLLPIAGIYRLSGVSILAGRVVIAVYALLAVTMLYLLGRRLISPMAGLIAVVLVISSPGKEFIYNSRTVLGEVPGLFFIFAGLLVWLHTSKPGLLRLVAAGVLFGLASITKNQYALIVLPALLVSWILDLVWYRQRGWRTFVIPGVIAGLFFFAWTYIVLFALGETSDIAENLATLRTASAGVFFLFNPVYLRDALRFLVDGAVFASLFIPGLLYALMMSRWRTDESQQWGIITTFLVLATGLYLTSIGWPRYAFPAIGLAVLPVTLMLTQVVTAVRPTVSGVLRGDSAQSAMAALIAGLAVVMVLLPVALDTYNIVQGGDRSIYALRDYLNDNIPQDAVIETWEQELSVMTDHRYHYPPQVTLAYAVQQTFSTDTTPVPVSEMYDFREYVDADYVINGPFAQFTGLYPEAYLADYTLIETYVTPAGPYQVWKRTADLP